MGCRVRYLSSAGIHTREIPGVEALASAFPSDWLLYASLQCYPRGEPPIEMDAMVVMDDRVLLLEIKDWNGKLTHNGDQWLINGRRRGRSPVDTVSMKARKVKSFLKANIPGFRHYVDSRVVLTGSATRDDLPDVEKPSVWTLQDACSIASSTGKANLLSTTTLFGKRAYQFENEFERLTRNAKMFGPLEANWDGYRVVEEDVVVHPASIWREHRAERVRDTRLKALLRVWSFDRLPPGLNSPEKRRFVAERELRAVGRLTALGSSLISSGRVLLPIGDDKEEILTQHSELRQLSPGWSTLDRFVRRELEALSVEERATTLAALLNLIAELHASGIAHRDLGPRAIWAGSETRLALTGLMSSQMPDEHSIADWASTLRGYWSAPSGIGDRAAKQQDVVALGQLARGILKAEFPPLEEEDQAIEEALPGIAGWFKRTGSEANASNYADAREMADDFARILEGTDRKDIDEGLLDRFQTSDLPYVKYPLQQNIRQSDRTHVYVAKGAPDDLIVKVWPGIQRGASAAVDLALMRLVAGVSRLVATPAPYAPRYEAVGLSAVGPFVVYRHESGKTLQQLNEESTLDEDQVLALCALLVGGIDHLHGMGSAHGDLSASNVLVRSHDDHPQLLDMFDLTNVGSARVRTPSLCPDAWETLTDQQLDRYAAHRLVESALARFEGSSKADSVLGVIRDELSRPKIETMKPLERSLKGTQTVDAALTQMRISFPLAEPGIIRPDSDDMYYVRVRTLPRGHLEYSLTGLDRVLVFNLVGTKVDRPRLEALSFASLAHASTRGIPIRCAVTCTAGPIAGFEQIIGALGDASPDGSSASASPAQHRAFDIRRYWRRLLELEQSLQPEVEILEELGPSTGPLATYAYERVGADFDFDAGSTVEVRLANGWRVGEVDLERTDGHTLVVDRSDRRLLVGDRVNLVERRARTSLDRRTKAVDRILDNEAAVPNLIDYLSPDKAASAQDHSVEVADGILERYQLNAGQRDAFRHIVRYGPVGLLQGPPGTGKTHFIASLVHWLVTEQGANRILIASQSNEAVNNAIEALLGLFARLGGRRPSLLRIGSKGITDKIRPFHTMSLQDRYQSRFASAFKHRVASLGTSVGLKRQLVLEGVELDRQLGVLTRRLQMLAFAQQPAEELTVEEAKQRDADVRVVTSALTAAGRAILGRELDPSKPEVELDSAYEELRLKHPGTSPSDIAILRQIIELSWDWEASLTSPHRNFEEFLAKTRTIVTATCVGAGQTKIRIDAKTFDWVIVDEAARCTPSELAVPIQVGRRILLVGDQRQLLPMTERAVLREMEGDEGLGSSGELTRSDFERAYTSSYGSSNGRTLTEQYRMAPPICGLVSRTFYEPGGVTLETSKDRMGDAQLGAALGQILTSPITWIDTSHQQRHVELSADWNPTTFWNHAEVETILRLLEKLADNSAVVDALAASSDGSPVGIICMYSAQKLKLEQAFAARPFEARFRRLVRIDTVDSYQGKENAVVIVSLVRCNDRRDQGHVRSANRCNVALSRAKERLVVVGARSMWERVAQESPMRVVLGDLDAHPLEATTIQAGAI